MQYQLSISTTGIRAGIDSGQMTAKVGSPALALAIPGMKRTDSAARLRMKMHLS